MSTSTLHPHHQRSSHCFLNFASPRPRSPSSSSSSAICRTLSRFIFIIFIFISFNFIHNVSASHNSNLNRHSAKTNAQSNNNVQLPTIDGQIASFSSLVNTAPSSSSSSSPNAQHPSSFSSSPSTAPSSTSSPQPLPLTCAAPEVLVNGAPSASIAGTVSGGPFGSISEIQFVGIVAATAADESSAVPVAQKRICKIKCLNGVWIGPLCALQNAEIFEPILRPCTLPVIANGTVTQVSPEPSEAEADLPPTRQLPHGSLVSIRCIQVGLYKLVGPAELSCVDGLWSAALPSCTATTMHSSNHSASSPPTIRHTMLEGSVGIDGRGRIVVPPGAMLHLDCLFEKSFGEPHWTVKPSVEAQETSDLPKQNGGEKVKKVAKNSSKDRKGTKGGKRTHTTGWSIVSSEHLSQYRLALYSATVADSGRYTCHTPGGQSNSVEVLVKEVECDPIEPKIAAVADSRRVHSISGRKMHDRVRFSCLDGYRLEGAQETRCTASGRWSHGIPTCKEVHCPDIDSLALDSKLFLSWKSMVQGDAAAAAAAPEIGIAPKDGLAAMATQEVAIVGTKITMRCAVGYRMLGTTEVRCSEDGQWSDAFPKCELITCPAPTSPVNGLFVEATSRYLLGDYIQYSCQSGYALRGQAVATCREDGTWSSSTPTCQRFCSYPSSLAHGHLIPEKLEYEPSEEVALKCDPGHGSSRKKVAGQKVVVCRDDGHWSEKITCEGT